MTLDDLYAQDKEFWGGQPTQQEAKEQAAYMEEAEDAVLKAHKSWNNATPEAVDWFIEQLINHPKFEQWAREYILDDPYADGTLSGIYSDAMSAFVEDKLP